MVPTRGTAAAVADDVATKPAVIVASAIVFMVEKANQTNCALKSHLKQHHSAVPPKTACFEFCMSLDHKAESTSIIPARGRKCERDDVPARCVAIGQSRRSQATVGNESKQADHKEFPASQRDHESVVAHIGGNLPIGAADSALRRAFRAHILFEFGNRRVDIEAADIPADHPVDESGRIVQIGRRRQQVGMRPHRVTGVHPGR